MTATFTAYNDKSSAKRGFARKFKDLNPTDADSYLDKQDGKWGFSFDEKGPILTNVPPASTVQPIGEEQAEVAQRASLFETKEIVADPELDAALEQHDEDGNDRPSALGALGAFAISQLTGNHSVPQAASSPARSKPVAKEKNRDEANGVKRPSSGTICAQVWDLAASMSHLSESGGAHTKVAKLSDVIKAAEAVGINKFTARTQYARWRVFNGILGRVGS